MADKIMERLQEHKNSALAAHPCDWFVICLQGSQNYGLADENSDIDSKMLTLPSVRELVLNLKPYNHVHIMEDESHVDCKDSREYFKIFRKSNINFVEILFTDYWIANPVYQDLWFDLLSRREELARINPYAAVSCMRGMAMEKRKALDHEYPSRMGWIEKYGYDPKQLSHLVRIKYFTERYIAGEPYRDCIDTPHKDYLLRLKRTGDGLSKEEAITLADKTMDEITDMANTFRETVLNKCNEELEEFMNDILYRLIGRAIKKDLA